MPEYKIETENEEFVINLPELADEKTKNIIKESLKNCVEEENQGKVMDAVNRVLSQTNSIIESLKKDDKYHEELEKDIREFIGIQINKGFKIGKGTVQPEEVSGVHKALQGEMTYEGDVIEDLPEDLQNFSRYIFGLLELGRMSIEVGLILGTLLSSSKAEDFYQNEADGLSYIR